MEKETVLYELTDASKSLFKMSAAAKQLSRTDYESDVFSLFP